VCRRFESCRGHQLEIVGQERTAMPMCAALRRRPAPEPGSRLRLAWVILGVVLLIGSYLLLWLLVERHWSPLRRLDRSTVGRLNGAISGHPGEIDAMKAVSLAFGPTVFRVAAVVVGVVLFRQRRHRQAVFILVAIGGGGLLDAAAKAWADRARPVVPHPIASAAGSSFPSGHALGALVGVGALLVVVLPVQRKRDRHFVVAAGLVVVVAVGCSRLALGVHYPSDVVGGWLLGGAWLLVTLAAIRPPRPAADSP
jgi:membrane-associated phospholipid phosphatase